MPCSCLVVRIDLCDYVSVYLFAILREKVCGKMGVSFYCYRVEVHHLGTLVEWACIILLFMMVCIIIFTIIIFVIIVKVIKILHLESFLALLKGGGGVCQGTGS